MPPDEEPMIDAMPAKRLQAMLPDLLPTFLPEGLRARFDAVADKFEQKYPDEWDARLKARRADLAALILKLEDWLDVPEWDLVFLGNDEDLLLFYVLKVQSAAIRIAELPESAWVPGHMDEAWRWMMTIHPEEFWIHWTFLLRGHLERLPNPLPIWRLVMPRQD